MSTPIEINEAPESLYLILEAESPLSGSPVVVRDEDEKRLLVAFTPDGLHDGFSTLMESCGLPPSVYFADEMDFAEIAELVHKNDCVGVAVDYSPDRLYRQILIAKAKYGEG